MKRVLITDYSDKEMKTQLSSLDISFLVKELSYLVGTRVDNIYQIGERDLKINFRADRKKELIITPRYFCLTKFEHPVPEKPSIFAMLLRKHLAGGIVKNIEQHRFDRIIEITVEHKGKLILEFFSRGNAIVTDENNVVLSIMESQVWKDRTLKPGQTYKYPPETPDVKNLTLSEYAVRFSKNKEIVKNLASDLGLGATYANEVLARANVDPTSLPDKKSVEATYSALKGIFNSEIKASLILGESGAHVPDESATNGLAGNSADALDKIAIDVAPFDLKIYEQSEKQEKESFNEAVDEYFTNLRTEGEHIEATKDYKKELERINVVIEKQKEVLPEHEAEIATFKAAGDLIYAKFQELEGVLRGISEAKAQGINWMEFLKEKGFAVTAPAERKFDFEGVGIFIDKSVSENASLYYEKSKKARSKLEGALSALRVSEAELREIEQIKAKAEKKLAGGPVERHRPEWYEKFRWFISSDGFLVIGGRDATTNEAIIKKHTDPHDLVFHSAVHGAPFFVVKNPDNRGIPENTKLETAEAAASYSSAWGDEIGSVDVYAMKPEQVTKTPNSGEYLAKGAFVIRGEREWFKGTALRLAMGFRVNDYYAISIGGPENAIKSQTKYYAMIGPGSKKSGELAEEIKSGVLRRAGKEDGQKIKKVILGEIQRWIPAGKGMMLK